jgi:hypothetical protein
VASATSSGDGATAALARAIARGELRAPVGDALVDAAIDASAGPLLAAGTPRAALTIRQRERLATARRDAAIIAAQLDRAHVRASAALANPGVECLALKGCHTAHALYATPDLRPRGDVDVLVKEGDRERASDALRSAGFRPSVHVRGSIILGQWHFDWQAPGGASVPVDLHWRPFAPLVLATAIDADALFRRAGSITVDGVSIRVPAFSHALALAVLHLAAHHAAARDLVWLNDVRLLTRALDARERNAFVGDARDHLYCAVAASIVSAAATLFDDDTLRDLARDLLAAARAVEPSGALLSPRRSPLGDLWMDLRVARWGERLRLIREHALPSREYMRAAGERGWLPLAYTRRAIRGAVRWR